MSDIPKPTPVMTLTETLFGHAKPLGDEVEALARQELGYYVCEDEAIDAVSDQVSGFVIGYKQALAECQMEIAKLISERDGWIKVNEAVVRDRGEREDYLLSQLKEERERSAGPVKFDPKTEVVVSRELLTRALDAITDSNYPYSAIIDELEKELESNVQHGSKVSDV